MRFGSVLSIPDHTMRGAAADVLTPTGAVIPASASVTEAEQRLVTLGASELYVIAADGQLAGILPDYDILKHRLAGDQRPRCVSDVMSPVDFRVTCSTPLSELAVRMRASCHRRIPVTANGRLIGEVTRRDLLRFLHAAGPDGCDTPAAAATADVATQNAAPGPPKFLRAAGSLSQLANQPGESPSVPGIAFAR
jgi:CBS domain-containing protein